MSEVLTPETPVEEAAVPEAPATASGVEGESAGATPQSVPAERFNGLMSKYQSEKTDWENRQAVMQAELESLRNKPQEQPVSDDLTAKVEQLTNLLAQRETESAREAVLKDFPLAAPFADLIVGNTPAEMRAVAETLHQRMELLTGTPETTVDDVEVTNTSEVASGDVVETPVAPEFGGGAAIPATNPSLIEAKEQALAEGNFEAFLDAQWAIHNAESVAG